MKENIKIIKDLNKLIDLANLLKDSIKSEGELSSFEKSSLFLLQSYSNDIVSENIQKEVAVKSEYDNYSLAKANKKIAELMLPVSKKINLEMINSFLNYNKKSIKENLSKLGIGSVVNVALNGYLFEIELKFYKIESEVVKEHGFEIYLNNEECELIMSNLNIKKIKKILTKINKKIELKEIVTIESENSRIINSMKLQILPEDIFIGMRI